MYANSSHEPRMNDGVRVVFVSRRRNPSQERALVLGTQGIDSEVGYLDGNFVVLVAAHEADRARAELDAYEHEDAEWSAPITRDAYVYANGWPGVFAYICLLGLLTWLSATGAGDTNWYSAGRVDAGRLLGGEWWRAITALTLHADLPHLAANLVFGSAFGYLAGRYFGSGVAWLAILIAGALGNLLNSVLLAPSHLSIGASTGIFAALGMISAFIWKHQTDPRERWARRLGPIVAGVAILAYFGTGGERTDVSAHLTGFLSGFVLGVVFALVLSRLPRGPTAQWASGLLAVGVLGVAWARALGGA